MAFNVKDPETDRVVRKLAALRGKGITEVIREAVEHALSQQEAEASPAVRIRELQARLAALPVRDPRAQKEIADELWEPKP